MPTLFRAMLSLPICAPVACQRDLLNDCEVVIGIANCERATEPLPATPCVPSDHQLYNCSPDEGMSDADPRLLSFSAIVIRPTISSIRTAWLSVALQNM